MPSRFNPEFDPEQPADDGKVDITKRYDVYCVEQGIRTVVYRNVLFRRSRTLLGNGHQFDFTSQVIELEQPNGKSVFIGRFSIAHFCEHGTDLSVEVITSK